MFEKQTWSAMQATVSLLRASKGRANAPACQSTLEVKACSLKVPHEPANLLASMTEMIC